MRRLAGFLLSACLAFAAAPAWADDSHPHVIDRANILFETTLDHLEADSQRIREATGVEVFVVVERTLGERSAKEVALAQPVWADDHDQVVLLMAMADEQVRIEASPSLTARIPDADWADLIQRSMLPDLRRGRVGAATRSGMDSIARRLEGEPVETHPLALLGDARAFRDMMFVLIAGLLAVIAFNDGNHVKMKRGRW